MAKDAQLDALLASLTPKLLACMKQAGSFSLAGIKPEALKALKRKGLLDDDWRLTPSGKKVRRHLLRTDHSSPSRQSPDAERGHASILDLIGRLSNEQADLLQSGRRFTLTGAEQRIIDDLQSKAILAANGRLSSTGKSIRIALINRRLQSNLQASTHIQPQNEAQS